MKKNNKLIWIAAALLAACYLCSTYLFQLILVRGDSMSPTYHNGMLVLLDKRETAYLVGDVIAFQSDSVKGIVIKRIVAVGTDYVQIKNRVLYVNGSPSEYYGDKSDITYSGIATDGILLGADEYFVMGDNYTVSTDSRMEEIGLVKSDQIIGKLLPQKRG